MMLGQDHCHVTVDGVNGLERRLVHPLDAVATKVAKGSPPSCSYAGCGAVRILARRSMTCSASRTISCTICPAGLMSRIRLHVCPAQKGRYSRSLVHSGVGVRLAYFVIAMV